MRILVSIVCTVFLVMFGWTSSASAVTDGRPVERPPEWIAAGYSHAWGGQVVLCSGTLVTRQVVISAAHCGPFEMVRLGGGTINSGLQVQVKESFFNSGRDIAVHWLERPVNRRVLRFNFDRELPLRTSSVIAMGYGDESPRLPSASDLRTTGWQPVLRADSSVVEFGRGRTSLCPGDSGGPTMARSARGIVLLAVNSYAACGRGLSGSANVAETAGWIRQIIAMKLAESNS